jgi:rubrerythrin
MKSNRRNFIKTASLAGVGIAGTVMIFGCSTRKPNKSVSNLETAYIREKTAEEKYLKYAQKAREDNFPKLAIMISAISKAEDIHKENHKKALVKLKGNYSSSQTDKYVVKSTFENLQEAYKTETYEYEEMYPAFIKSANDEKVPEAVETFTWARQVEKQHQGYYGIGLTTLGIKSERSLPEAWYVCPKCGGTYAVADVKNTCYFDPTPKEQFIEFK